MFSSFFGNDPFFGESFEQMERMMDSMLGDRFGRSASAGFPSSAQHHQHQRQHQQRRGYEPGFRRDSGPVIEEVEDGESDDGSAHVQPIVEEPGDDYGHRQNTEQRYRNHHRSSQRYRDNNSTGHRRWGINNNDNNTINNDAVSGVRMELGPDGFPNITTFDNGSTSTMVSYSSSYSSVGGSNGVVYSSTSSTRIGPGGVRETQTTVRDGRSGQESITVSRGIGDRSRTITRNRNAQGAEERQDILQNIELDETDTFEQEWNAHAQRNLPGGTNRLQGPRQGSQTGGHPRLEYRGSRGRYV